MFLLPKGNPLYENVAAARVKLPEMLGKLAAGGFSGYVLITFPSSEGILLFEGGKMVSAMNERGGRRSSGLEAIASIFASIFSDSGSLSVYRLSNDLTMCLHALLHGEMLYRGQELKLMDVKGLLAKLKEDRLNGCLRIYAGERAALIFYRDGSPLGFFHDGSDGIEKSATESQRIAGLPGAKMDVLSTKTPDELMLDDLLEMVNVPKMWESARSRYDAERQKARASAEVAERRKREQLVAELEADLKEIAAAYLGKMGSALVEKEIREAGGAAALADQAPLDRFVGALERGAKLLVGSSRIKEMSAAIRDEIAGRIVAPAAEGK